MTVQANYNKPGDDPVKNALIKLINTRGDESNGWTGTFAVYRNKTSYTKGADPVTQFSYFIDGGTSETLPEEQLYNAIKTSGILDSVKDL